MNKKTVNEWISPAYRALADHGIAVDGKVKKTYRGQISTFGAAISTGSLRAAVAFFSDNGAASVKRDKLMDAILDILQKEEIAPSSCKNLYQYVDQNELEAKEPILNATIALKLAMNLYHLEQEK